MTKLKRGKDTARYPRLLDAGALRWAGATGFAVLAATTTLSGCLEVAGELPAPALDADSGPQGLRQPDAGTPEVAGGIAAPDPETDVEPIDPPMAGAPLAPQELPESEE